MFKYYLVAISSFFAVSQSICNAESHLSRIPIDICSEYNKKSEFEIDELQQKKYQVASKWFSKSSSKEIETSIVSYETLTTGVQLHVGWYVDGSICTALNGTEQGKQVVFLNGSVVGISYDISAKGDHFVHKYTWGKVYSYGNHQVIKFN